VWIGCEGRAGRRPDRLRRRGRRLPVVEVPGRAVGVVLEARSPSIILRGRDRPPHFLLLVARLPSAAHLQDLFSSGCRAGEGARPTGDLGGRPLHAPAVLRADLVQGVGDLTWGLLQEPDAL